MTNIDQYIFWSKIQHIAENLDDLSDYREEKWVENFSFKENLKIDIKIFDNLLEIHNQIKLKNNALGVD